jgi:hypothetical protein
VVQKTSDTLLAAVLLYGLLAEVVVHILVASGSAVLAGTRVLDSESMNTDMTVVRAAEEEEMADDTSAIVVRVAVQGMAHGHVVQELADHTVVHNVPLHMGDSNMVDDDTAVQACSTA